MKHSTLSFFRFPFCIGLLLAAAFAASALEINSQTCIAYDPGEKGFGLSIGDAVSDLAAALKKISGAEVSLCRDKTLPQTKSSRILIGKRAIEACKLDDTAARLPHGAYIIQTRGNDLLIFGGGAKGSSNGIYGFLQDCLGVRYFAPLEEFVIYPPRPKIELDKLDVRAVPSFALRCAGISNSHARIPEIARYIRRNRGAWFSREKDEPFSNFSHGLSNIYRGDRYGATHPEYFPLYDGKRYIPVKGDVNWQPCLSGADPEVAAQAAERFFMNPEMSGVTAMEMGMNDIIRPCCCASCLENRKKFGGTGEFFLFLNKVAKRVREKMLNRECYLGTLAYFQTKTAPGVAIDPMVFISFCTDFSEFADPAYRDDEYRILNEWRKKNIPIVAYLYLSLSDGVPIYFPHALAENMKKFHQLGIRGFHDDILYNLNYTGPMRYVYFELLWNIDQDVDILLDEYFTKLYGPAAQPVKNMYECFETAWSRIRRGGFLRRSGSQNSADQFLIYNADDVSAIERNLETARGAAAKDKSCAVRVDLLSKSLKPILHQLKSFVQARKLKNAANTIKGPELNRILSELPDCFAAAEEARQMVKDNRETIGPLLSESGPMRNIQQYLDQGFGKFLGELSIREQKEKFPEETAKLLNRAIVEFRKDDYRKLCLAYYSGNCRVENNIAPNPGFETWTGGKPTPWDAYVATQAKYPIRQVCSAATGRYAVATGGSLDTVDINCKIRNLKPGDSYVFSVKVKAERRLVGGANANIKVGWRGNDRWNWSLHNFRVDAESDDGWQVLTSILVVPDGMDEVCLFLGTGHNYDNESVIFDDVVFARIVDKPVRP